MRRIILSAEPGIIRVGRLFFGRATREMPGSVSTGRRRRNHWPGSPLQDIGVESFVLGEGASCE